MSPDTYQQLDIVVGKSPILHATELPTDCEVVDAELALGVSFDPDYRDFVLRYGGAMVGAYPVYGLRPVEVMDERLWSVVDVTRHYRSMGLKLTESWVVISADHAGNPVGMDKNGNVWIYDHDFGGASKLANSFEEYLRVRCLNLPRVTGDASGGEDLQTRAARLG